MWGLGHDWEVALGTDPNVSEALCTMLCWLWRKAAAHAACLQDEGGPAHWRRALSMLQAGPTPETLKRPQPVPRGAA